jgi:hypothetical protein
MNTNFFVLVRLGVLGLAAAGGIAPAVGQGNGTPTNALSDTVFIFATDAQAFETGPDPGTFTVRRTGPTNYSLAVFYSIGGTASNGVDYQQIAGAVSIPAGAYAAQVKIFPIADNMAEGRETVVLQIVPSPLLCPSPACGYDIGSPSSAVVTIEDNAAVHQPVVNVFTIDPVGREIPVVPPGLGMPQLYDPAVFRVTRTGNTNIDLPVFYRVSGSASNGVDYERLSGQVVIPAGSASALIEVTVIDDLLVEGTETVEITLEPPICIQIFPPPPDCYLVGSINRAIAFIEDNDLTPTPTNGPVFVNIVARDPFASEGTLMWGTNNTATFIVSRTGSTNAALAVGYGIGGTASNGVDYVMIPDSVTIPAGRRSARVVIRPIDDGVPEPIETVVLSLKPAADYNLGIPARAAAIITDASRTRPPCLLLSDHLFHMCIPRNNGFWFRVEASADLARWTPVCTNVVVDGAVHFVDPDAQPYPHRFYRVAPVPPLPPDE